MKYVKKPKRNVMTKNIEGKMYQLIWILIVAAINIYQYFSNLWCITFDVLIVFISISYGMRKIIDMQQRKQVSSKASSSYDNIYIL
jgi:general stress protein CsbA